MQELAAEKREHVERLCILPCPYHFKIASPGFSLPGFLFLAARWQFGMSVQARESVRPTGLMYLGNLHSIAALR